VACPSSCSLATSLATLAGTDEADFPAVGAENELSATGDSTSNFQAISVFIGAKGAFLGH
jgi:hypothetical protein